MGTVQDIMTLTMIMTMTMTMTTAVIGTDATDGIEIDTETETKTKTMTMTETETETENRMRMMTEGADIETMAEIVNVEKMTTTSRQAIAIAVHPRSLAADVVRTGTVSMTDAYRWRRNGRFVLSWTA